MSNQKHTVGRHDTPINEEWLALQELIRKHSGTALTGILVVAVAAVAVWTLFQRQEQNQRQAQQLLASAQSSGQFEEIINRFPKSEAAPLALLSVAKLHFDMGQYQDAIASYDNFLNQWPEHPLAQTAVLGRLFALEAQGDTARIQEAEAGFRAFAEKHPGHYLYPQARLGEARCKQQLGQLEEARGIYQDFLDTHPDNPWVAQIEERLLDLERKLSRRQSS